MFLFDSSLFWYKLVFMTELLVAEFLFTFKLRKRTLYPLRGLGMAAVCCLAAFMYPLYEFNAFYSTVMFFVLFALTIPLLLLCYREPLKNLIFCGIASYAAQHTAYTVYSLMIMLLGLENGFLSAYGDGVQGVMDPWMTIVYFASYATVYWLIFLFFADRINKKENLKIDNFSLVALAGGIVVIDIFIGTVVIYHSLSSYDFIYVLVAYVLSVLCCLFALMLQFGILTKRKLETELTSIQQLLHIGREQYALSKENIDLINVKCHDLRHQIRRIGRMSSLDEATIEEIESAVDIYDSVVKTGNEALDIILTEKSLLCRKNGISLSCVVDGGALGFMSLSDIYSLFGNAIENAIESVKKLDELEKRIISMTVKKIDKLLSVHIDNYYSGEVRFIGEYPETTKADKSFHGYGVKSIKYISEKYDGSLSFIAKDGVFTLNMLFNLH